MKGKKAKAKSEKPKAKNSSLVITGFMGMGKTSAARIVAKKLEREFVDMDAVIESREGKKVREIFETRGEAYFRAREAVVCAELGARENLVIATGGGALVSDANLSRFANAFVVCLDATEDQIVSRLSRSVGRPLLRENPRRRIAELLKERRAAYARIERHVDTSGKSATRVADEIIAMFRKADL